MHKELGQTLEPGGASSALSPPIGSDKIDGHCSEVLWSGYQQGTLNNKDILRTPVRSSSADSHFDPQRRLSGNWSYAETENSMLALEISRLKDDFQKIRLECSRPVDMDQAVMKLLTAVEVEGSQRSGQIQSERVEREHEAAKLRAELESQRQVLDAVRRELYDSIVPSLASQSAALESEQLELLRAELGEVREDASSAHRLSKMACDNVTRLQGRVERELFHPQSCERIFLGDNASSCEDDLDIHYTLEQQNCGQEELVHLQSRLHEIQHTLSNHSDQLFHLERSVVALQELACGKSATWHPSVQLESARHSKDHFGCSDTCTKSASAPLSTDLNEVGVSPKQHLYTDYDDWAEAAVNIAKDELSTALQALRGDIDGQIQMALDGNKAYIRTVMGQCISSCSKRMKELECGSEDYSLCHVAQMLDMECKQVLEGSTGGSDHEQDGPDVAHKLEGRQETMLPTIIENHADEVEIDGLMPSPVQADGTDTVTGLQDELCVQHRFLGNGEGTFPGIPSCKEISAGNLLAQGPELEIVRLSMRVDQLEEECSYVRDLLRAPSEKGRALKQRWEELRGYVLTGHGAFLCSTWFSYCND